MLFTLESGENRLTLGIFLPIIEMIMGRGHRCGQFLGGVAAAARHPAVDGQPPLAALSCSAGIVAWSQPRLTINR
jgi:hypothetical protein